MMEDKQIIRRPDCQKCGIKEGAMVFFRTKMVCGNCAIKLTKKFLEKEALWIEEINLDE